jgi:hypothetical protein
VPELLDLSLLAGREVGEKLVPALVGDRACRLGDVAENRESARGAAGDHPQLHRGEVLRLVDDHMAVLRRCAVEEGAGLVQQRKVAVAPAASPALEQRLLVLVEKAVRGVPKAIT